MMHARIVGDVVVELILDHPDWTLAERFHPDVVATLRAVPDGLQVAVGWTFDGTQFSPPASIEPPAAPAIRTIRTFAFRKRLPAATRQAITLAAAAAMRADPPDATLQTWLDDLASTGTVLLDDPDLVAGVTALHDAGLITEAERDALLADGTLDETR